jgi:hypothetical protein
MCEWETGRYMALRSSMARSLEKQKKQGTEQVLWHGPGSVDALEGIVLR